MKSSFKSLLGVLFLFSMPWQTNAQDWHLAERLTPDNLVGGDNLGISVAITDSFMIAGAWWEDADDVSGFVNSAGAAQIFRLNSSGNWEEMQKLNASNPEVLGYFGFCVAIEGRVAVVGAYNEDVDTFLNAGAIYVYTLNDGDQWVESAKLTAPDPENAAYLGYELRVSGDFIAAGAYQESEDENGANTMNDAGAVYLYQANGNDWDLIQKIVPSDRAPNDEFGRNLDIEGERMIVGANLKDNGFDFEQGAAYVYEYSTSSGMWEEVQKLLAPDGDAFDDFGWSVAIENDLAMVAASSEENLPGGGFESNTGAVYCYHRQADGSWMLAQKIYAPDHAQNDFFGRDIDIQGSYAVIGAETEDEDGSGGNSVSDAGSAYVFQLQGADWEFMQKVIGTNRGVGDLFGASVSMHLPNIAVGAWLADVGNKLDAGACYIFRNDDISSRVVDIRHNAPAFRIYPNPSHGALNLDPGDQQFARFELYDVQGTWCASSDSWQGLQNRASVLPGGMYVLVATRPDGAAGSRRWIKLR